MKRLSPDQIRQVYDRGPDAVVGLVTPLFDMIEWLEAQVQGLQVRVAERERQAHRNSRNSSQPPSADGLRNHRRAVNGARPGARVGASRVIPGRP